MVAPDLSLQSADSSSDRFLEYVHFPFRVPFRLLTGPSSRPPVAVIGPAGALPFKFHHRSLDTSQVSASACLIGFSTIYGDNLLGGLNST